MEKRGVHLYDTYVDAKRLNKRLVRRRDRAYAVHYEIRYRKNFYEYMKALAEPEADYDAPVDLDTALEVEVESEMESETDSEFESSLQTVINSGTYKDSQNKQKNQQSQDLNDNVIVIDSEDNREAESPMLVTDNIAGIDDTDDTDDTDDLDYPFDPEPFYAGASVIDSVNGNLDLNSIDLITENRGTWITSSNDRYYGVETQSLHLTIASQTQSQSQDQIRPIMCASPGTGSDTHIAVLRTPSIQAAQQKRQFYVEHEPIDEIMESNSDYSSDFMSQKMFGKTSTQQ